MAHDLATVLAHLHGALEAVSAAMGPLPASTHPATIGTLRARFGALVRPDQHDRILSWCDHNDRVLASPARAVLVHGDLHGDNHLWDRDPPRLRLVIDLETAGVGEPEFDLRCLPGDCGTDLFLATVARYETVTAPPSTCSARPRGAEAERPWRHRRAHVGEAHRGQPGR